MYVCNVCISNTVIILILVWVRILNHRHVGLHHKSILPPFSHRVHGTQVGVMLHQVLPRTLQIMSEGNLKDKDLQDILTHINMCVDEDGEDSVKDRDWEEMLLDIEGGANADITPAELNRKRKRLAFSAILDNLFVPKTLLMEYLNSPLSHAMHRLMRTGDIALMHQLAACADGSDDAKFASMFSRPGVDQRDGFLCTHPSLPLTTLGGSACMS